MGEKSSMIKTDPASVDAVMALPYIELLAWLGESNLPPGGFDTIRRLVLQSHARAGQAVLHVGCSAGFLSREFARLTGAKVTGIDRSPAMVAAATRRAEEEKLSGQVSYECQDMCQTRFATGHFDVTVCGGALAFVEDHIRAVSEWVRVTKPFGLIVDTELYYHSVPPERVRTRVAEIIGVEVPVRRKDDWTSLFELPQLIPCYHHDAPTIARTSADVENYCAAMIEFRASDLKPDVRKALFDRLVECFNVFNENLKYMSYLVLGFRRMPDHSEPMLFI
jgi:SAM-dependent methyltransferase